MKTLKYSSYVLLLLLLGCQAQPEPIHYGEDACHFCKMTIVDKVHGAEVVTKKGKVYKFDAIECMVNFRKEFDTTQIEHYLNNHLTQAEELIDASTATFLISENVPSPMGAFLSAFENRADAEALLKEKGGKLYTWNELIRKLE